MHMEITKIHYISKDKTSFDMSCYDKYCKDFQRHRANSILVARINVKI